MTSYQTNMKAIRLSIFLTILTLIMQACSPSNKGNEMAQDDGPLASANEIEEIEEEPIKIKHKFSTAEGGRKYKRVDKRSPVFRRGKHGNHRFGFGTSIRCEYYH